VVAAVGSEARDDGISGGGGCRRQGGIGLRGLARGHERRRGKDKHGTIRDDEDVRVGS
jgi:hypothetical protein